MDMFEFLEPWRAILRDILQRDGDNSDAAKSVVSLSFIPLDKPPEPCLTHAFTVRFPVDETSRRDKKRLQKIRDAVELFTTLSMVNNKAFKKMVPMPTWINAADERIIYPRWKIWIRGTLAPTDPAAIQSPVTWGILLGISDHSSLSSPEFREAALKLESMGYEKTSEVFIRSRFGISWEIKVRGSYTIGRQELDESAAVRTFQTLLDIDVPPIVQVFLRRKCDKLVEISQQTHGTGASCSYLSTTIRNFTESVSFPEMAVALARTTISDRFSLRLEDYDSVTTDIDVMDPLQVVRNVGVLLSTLLCGRSLCNMSGDNCCSSPIICTAKHGRLCLTCYPMPSDRVFIGMCSAVAEMLPEIRLEELGIHCTNPERWSWLVYALCCGGSNLALSTLEILWSTLTKSTMFAIAETLRVFYPTVSKQNCTSVYGFVEIREGTGLWPCDFEDRSDNAVLIASSTYRCRARMDPSSDGFVEIIVPGYGACQTKLDDNIHFTPDSGNSSFQKKRLCKRLALYFDTIESVELVMDLLQLLFSGICELDFMIHNNDNTNQTSLDLSTLASVCPALREFDSDNFNVVASAHNEALRKWPIEDMGIRHTETVSDVLSCLRNPALRMARQLVRLWVAPHPHRNFTEDEVREIESLSGEYLPVMKDKLPAQSKVALISVVLSGFTTSHSTTASKVMHHLDANVLSLIFVFASTPARRSVWC